MRRRAIRTGKPEKTLELSSQSPEYLRCHDRYGIRLNQKLLKSCHVELSQGATPERIRHIVRSPIVLSVVCNEVFRTSADALPLDAVDHGAAEVAGEERILAEVLKVSTTARISVQVDPGAHDGRNLLGPGLASKGLAQALHQVDVPCCPKAGSAREADGFGPTSGQDIRYRITRINRSSILDAIDSLGELRELRSAHHRVIPCHGG
jgi:hypothetical protein